MFDIVKFIEMHEDASDFFKICIHVQLVVYATYKKMYHQPVDFIVIDLGFS
jgi:hypothetical protein